MLSPADPTPESSSSGTPDPAPELGPGQLRSRRLRLWLPVAVVVVAGAAVAAWFALLSPQDSSVSLSTDSSLIDTGQVIEVHGSVTPSDAARAVEVQYRAGSDQWRTVETATTTSDGGFAVSVDPGEDTGRIQIRALALEGGRLKSATTAPVTVTIRAASTVAASPPARMRTDRSAVLTGTLAPGDARTVLVETSTDQGNSWASLTTTTSAPDGSFKVKLVASDRMTGLIRVRVEATDDLAGAATKPAKVIVEDYGAAGKAYLRAIEPSNAIVDTFTGSFPTFVAAQDYWSRYAAAVRDGAAKLKDYRYWPQEVMPPLQNVIRELTVSADAFANMARSSSYTESDEILYSSGVDASGAAAAEVRSILGLPERPVT